MTRIIKTISISEDIYNAVAKMAESEGRSVSNMIEVLLKEKIDYEDEVGK